jgi:cell shape-determining protein MreD
MALAVILQSSIISEIQLLKGYADLPMILLAAWALQERVESAWHWAAVTCLFVGFLSGLPWIIFVLGYFGIIFIARALQKRIWQAPLLAMFSVVFIGTIVIHILSFGVLNILGTTFNFSEVVTLITLPSLLLNMLFSIPAYTLMRDLSYWVYPAEVMQ